MMKIIKNLGIKNLGVFIFIGCITISSFAKTRDIASYDETNNDYDANYYGNEGSLTFKARISGIISNAKQKNLPEAKVLNPIAVNYFAKNGFGGDAATVIFFSNNISAEISVGFNLLRVKHSSLASISHNYQSDVKIDEKRHLYMIPATVIGQYQIAPFGGIRPYIGAGCHGTYFFSRSKYFNVKAGYGLVAQAGIDFFAKDDTLINLDIRQYFLKTKVKYKHNLLGSHVTSDSISSRVKFNPLIISVGVGFKF